MELPWLKITGRRCNSSGIENSVENNFGNSSVPIKTADTATLDDKVIKVHSPPFSYIL
jgi:hypothetical protein